MAGKFLDTILGIDDDYDDYDDYDELEVDERASSDITPSKKIFISWSGERSKQIARELKNTLENKIFSETGLECFVSDVDIISGADWWSQIHEELSNCSLGIVCITKENIQAPWIYFESGAMIARDLKTIPLLFHCSAYDLSQTPLSSKHMVDFSNMEKFNIMIKNINHELELRDTSDTELAILSSDAYTHLNDALSDTLTLLKKMRSFSAQYVYPNNVKTVIKNTLYISAPMSSLTVREYEELRNFLLNLKIKLMNKCGFSSVESPLLEKKSALEFDGNKKAIHDNFRKMKQVDSLLVIYPKSICSSILVEIGYAMALSKNTVIFYKDALPYILQEADKSIKHIDARKYENYSDIEQIICSNGRLLFDTDEGDE